MLNTKGVRTKQVSIITLKFESNKKHGHAGYGRARFLLRNDFLVTKYGKF